MTRKLCRDFEHDLARNLKTNPKAFWRYTNSKLKNKPKLGDLEQEDGSYTQDDLTKAQLLNTFFSSVFTRENTESMPTIAPRHDNKFLNDLTITPVIIAKKPKKLKPTKSAGPDGLHPRVLVETADTICYPLEIIFTKSFNEKHLPECWKMGHITPIHKKGSKKTPGNYRPVSLTAVIGKVMESLVRDRLVHHMTERNLFCDAQHGFVTGRLCMTQLKKAFDNVPHKRLLLKLEAYGISGTLKDWISDFLFGRKQQVIVNGKPSTWAEVLGEDLRRRHETVQNHHIRRGPPSTPR